MPASASPDCILERPRRADGCCASPSRAPLRREPPTWPRSSRIGPPGRNPYERTAMRTVIKAGGSAGVDRDAVADLVTQRAREGEVVLVHGASAETDRLSAALGRPARTIVSPSGDRKSVV